MTITLYDISTAYTVRHENQNEASSETRQMVRKVSDIHYVYAFIEV
jgi:hypothetical protein